MWSPRHIVVGTDFSKTSRGVVREALRLAERFGCRLSVVNVHLGDTPPSKDAVSEFLASERFGAGFELREAVVLGSRVAPALAEYAERERADLICVGPLARGFFEKHVLGGIAEQLLTHTNLATLTTAAPSTGYKKAMVAFDNSQASEHALEIAAGLLEDAPEARLIVFRALSGQAVNALSKVDDASIEQAVMVKARADLEKQVRASISIPGEKITYVVERGPFAKILPDMVKEHSPDLVSMGTVASKGLMGIFSGSSAGQVMKHLSFPLIVAQP